MNEKDAHRETFREEAKELLTELEASLLELEEQPGDAELIGKVFRAMHTIKGSGAMFGFDALAAFTHEVETVFDLVRNGAVPLSRDLVDVTLAARDRIRAMLDASDGAADEDPAATGGLIARFRKFLPASPLSGSDSKSGQCRRETPPSPPAPGQSRKQTTYRVYFRPPADMAFRGIDPLGLLRELRKLGACTITARTADIPPLDALNAESCAVSWDAVLTTDRGIDAVRDIFIFIEDDAEVTIDVIESPAFADDAADKKLGDILLERGDVEPDAVHQALSRQKRFGQVLVEMGAIDAGKVASALAEQEHVKERRERQQKEEALLSVKVPAAKLDKLVDLVGELVTIQARLTQAATGRDKAAPAQTTLRSIAEEVERLTTELRDSMMSIRMLPIGTTFSKFKRLVRDLSQELGKEISFETRGGETELDKTVIERLGDPLVHLIRNSIDHGIEPPGVRLAAGKPRQGTIGLSAVHSGANVLIRIDDDGAGLDKEAIRAKAVEQGLLAPDAAMEERDLFQLILAPGFSTAKKISNVSGRGVGMDVVKKTMDALRGTIEISSREGAGTTMILKLPLTLAIIEGFLTKIGQENFVFPLSVVEECVELSHADAEKRRGRHLADVRGRLVPYISLREQFQLGGAAPAVEHIVITRLDDQRIGFVVDQIIGSHQTVLKNLGKFYRDVKNISGATILGDGTVALILDVQRLFESAVRDEHALCHTGNRE